MLLSTACPRAFRRPKQVVWQDSCQWVREMYSTRASWKVLRSHMQRVCMQNRAVTKYCRQQLNLSHVGRPASAPCQLLLFRVFVKDHKTGEIRSLSISDCQGLAACTQLGCMPCPREVFSRFTYPRLASPARLQAKHSSF